MSDKKKGLQKLVPPRVNCDRLWTDFMTWWYRAVKRQPRVTNDPPPLRTRR